MRLYRVALKYSTIPTAIHKDRIMLTVGCMRTQAIRLYTYQVTTGCTADFKLECICM